MHTQNTQTHKNFKITKYIYNSILEKLCGFYFVLIASLVDYVNNKYLFDDLEPTIVCEVCGSPLTSIKVLYTVEPDQC